jgi:signal transduction histidine kinase
VTAREFHLSHEAREVELRYPGLKVVGFADLLRRDEIAARARQVRAEARASGLPYPRFAIHPRTRAARVAPITYIEPWAGNEAALGFDFLSEPRHRAALERTLASGDPEATAPVRLIQERGRQLGFLLMLATPDPRGRNAGIAYAGFRMGELVERVVPAEERGASIEVYDIGSAGAKPLPLARAELTYDGDKAADRDALAARPPRYGSRTIELEVMGRRWAVYYAPDQSLAPANQQLLNWLPLIVGAALALLVAWLLRVSLRTERRAVALAERMTESLRESQTELARSNAELERFAYVASHDLREPLRTITGFLGLLSRRHRERLDDDGREFIDRAVAGAKRIDDRLHRGDDVEGTGMGLAICKKIVEQRGGRIWVESSEGEGARFTFALPAAEHRPAAA